MTTGATIGFGSSFQTNYSGSWLQTAEVVALNLPPVSRDAIDTSHECLPDEWDTSVVGLNDAGDITVEMNLTNDWYLAFYNELEDKTVWPRRVVMPDNRHVEFNGYLTALEVGLSVGEKIACTARFKVVGEPTLLTT